MTEAFDTDGPQATEAVGARLARRLVPGDLVHLIGELGAGKTTLVRGACRELGVDATVTSPTFAIAHRYATAGGLFVAHLDLYRISGLLDEDPDLLADYLGEDVIAFAEWPPERDGELGTPRVTVELFHRGGDLRRIEVRG